MPLDAKIPSGPIEKKWEKAKFDLKLVNPANKRKYRSSSSAPASPAARQRRRSVSSATRS